MNSKILISTENCTGCSACVQICPRDCFLLNDENISVFQNSELCHNCGHCVSVCPESAISHTQLPAEDFLPLKDSLRDDYLSTDQMYYLLKSIRSTRKFKQKPVESDIIDKIIDVVRYSPTGHHAQNVELVVLSSPEMITQIKKESSEAISYFLKRIDNPFYSLIAKLIGKGDSIRRAKKSRHRFIRMQEGFQNGVDYLFHGAPVVLIFHANENSTVPAANCNIAAANVRLLCHSHGLGSCFIGYLIYYSKYNKRINELLKIPKENKIYQVLVIGYPKYRFNTFVSRKPSKVQLV